VEARDGIVGDFVAPVLELANLFGEKACLANVVERFRELAGRFYETRRVLLERVVKDPVVLFRTDHASPSSGESRTLVSVVRSKQGNVTTIALRIPIIQRNTAKRTCRAGAPNVGGSDHVALASVALLR
jgi:hypothetical protein